MFSSLVQGLIRSETREFEDCIVVNIRPSSIIVVLHFVRDIQPFRSGLDNFNLETLPLSTASPSFLTDDAVLHNSTNNVKKKGEPSSKLASSGHVMKMTLG